MISRTLWVVCFALFFAGFFSGFVVADVDISLNIELDPDEIDPGDSFDVKLQINNTDDKDLTDSDDIEIAIYVDDVLVHEDVEHEDIPQNSSKTITISSTRFNTEDGDVWEKSLLGYDCDEKIVEVKLSGDVSGSDEATLDIDGRELYVGMEPDNPTPGSEIVVEVEDDNGDLLDNIYVRITHLGDDEEWDMDDVLRRDDTDDGKVTFSPLNEDIRFKGNPYGKYQLDVWDDNYCLFSDTFEVTNKLKIAEIPENPYAGEEIRVKILDIDDNKVENVGFTVSGSSGLVGTYKSDSNGYVKFTINEAGSYTVIASKTGYEDSEIITINVKIKEGMDIDIEPIKQAISKDVVITITSGGNPLGGAEVTIKRPDGETDVLSTSSAGKVIYKPTLPGTYDVTVKKTAYETTTSSFKAMNFFDITIPENPKLHEEISVMVKNQDGDPVEDASVALIGTDITGLTSSEGRFIFILEKTGEYTLTIKKEGYEEFSKEISIYGELQLRVAPEILDLEDSVTIEVLDENGQRIEANIQIIKPDGEQETIVKNSHTFIVKLAGRYDITASKDYYAPSSSSFTVNPYPLDLDVWLSGKDLMVKATSDGGIVQNISISVLTPNGDEIPITTDESGIAKLDLKELNQTGTFVVSSVDRNFEEKTITKEIKGLGGGLMPLLLIAIVIIILLILVSFIFYISHKKGKSIGARPRKRKGTGLGGL